jgi:tetratricopeptide (TPR) repeat protein
VEAAATKAIELDKDLADAHVVLAQLARDAWDWKTAEREYIRAVELSPNLSEARLRYSNFLSDIGRHDQAIAEARRVKDLDPQNILSHLAVPYALLSARRFEESFVEIKKTLEIEGIYGAYMILGGAYTGKGLHTEAIDAFNEAIRLGGKDTYLKILLGVSYARAGQREKAQTILRQLEKSKEYVSPGELPLLYAALGEREKAIGTLEKAYAAHDLQLQHLNVDLGFDPLRDDPRFQDLLRRVGLPH